MSYRTLLLNSLVVNRANDRHGELENETAAIAWLFNNREQHMRNLTRISSNRARSTSHPSCSPRVVRYTVYDGNRRVTCLKLLTDPRRAPSTELQRYFAEQACEMEREVPCQYFMPGRNEDRDRIDDIFYRPHR